MPCHLPAVRLGLPQQPADRLRLAAGVRPRLPVVGSFSQLVALADQHVAGQIPPPAGLFDRILAAVRVVS